MWELIGLEFAEVLQEEREMCRGIQEIKHEDVFYLMSSLQISHVLHYFPHFQIQNNLLHCVWNVVQRSI